LQFVLDFGHCSFEIVSNFGFPCLWEVGQIGTSISSSYLAIFENRTLETRCREMYETWYKMTVMIQSGLDITPLITHRFHFTEYEKGFEVMRSGQSGKVILNWS